MHVDCKGVNMLGVDRGTHLFRVEDRCVPEHGLETAHTADQMLNLHGGGSATTALSISVVMHTLRSPNEADPYSVFCRLY